MDDVVTRTTTTTTTVTVQPPGRIHFDIGYLKTVPGILKVVQIILALITFICAIVAQGPGAYEYIHPFRPGHAAWAAFVSCMAFILTLAWLMFHLFHVSDTAPRLPWLLFELVYYSIWTFFFFISGAVLAAMSHDVTYYGPYYGVSLYGNYYSSVKSASGAGAFFAFALAILFAVNAALIFREWRNRRVLAQTQTVQA